MMAFYFMISIICGTNREDSISRKLANLYYELLKKRGLEAQKIDLINLPANFLSEILYDKIERHPDFQIFIKPLENSDKYIFIVPEYNGSFPGVLKSFIDGLPYPSAFENKKAALLGVSSGIQGAGLALSHLTDILNYCGCNILAFKPKLSKISQHIEGDSTISTPYLQLIEEQIERFISF